MFSIKTEHLIKSIYKAGTSLYQIDVLTNINSQRSANLLKGFKQMFILKAV
jgi:hypothetical protein